MNVLPEDLISAYLDGECSEAERVAVAARLESDREWQAVLADVSVAAMRCARSHRSNRLRGSSNRSSPGPRPTPARAHRSRRSRTVAGLAAVAAIVVGFVLASPKHDNTRCRPSDRDAGRLARRDRLAAVGSGQRPRTDRGHTGVDGAAAVRRKLLLAGGAIGLLVLAIAVAAGADDAGDTGSEWSGVIDEARHQMESQAFDGLVVVEWHDQTGTHRTQMEVRQHAGVVEVVNADRTVASDASSVMLDGQAWTMLSGAKGGGAVPDLTRGSTKSCGAPDPRSRVRRRRGTRRSTTATSSSDCSCKTRRAWCSGAKCSTPPAPLRAPSRSCTSTRLPNHPRRRRRPHRTPGPRRSTHLASPYRDPASAGNGYRLLGRWDHGDDLAQLYYTDGVLSVSVFEQPGRLDWSVLPPDGDTVEIGGRPARRYALPVGEAWVFERGGVVYTCVGDAPADEVAAIAADVSAPEPSRAARFAELVVDPFRW